MLQLEPVQGGSPGGAEQLWSRVHPEKNLRGPPHPRPSAWILLLCIFILKCVYRCVGFLEGIREEGSECGCGECFELQPPRPRGNEFTFSGLPSWAVRVGC